jgi:Fe-S-cluster containining protein
MRSRVKRHGILRDRSVDDDWRCRACDGVCCRSFVAVELSWAEYERLAALGATRLELSLRGRHKLVIDGGCEFLAAGRCRIYADRPEVCRRFICDDVAGCEAAPAHLRS